MFGDVPEGGEQFGFIHAGYGLPPGRPRWRRLQNPRRETGLTPLGFGIEHSDADDSADMSRAARDAHTPRSRTTAAAIGTARSARGLWRRNGWQLARPIYCRCHTIDLVFTLPRRRSATIAYQNKAVIYDILFKTSAETLITIAADPRHLGARVSITSVLRHLGFGAHPSPAHPHDRAGRQHLARRRRALGGVQARLLPCRGADALACSADCSWRS